MRNQSINQRLADRRDASFARTFKGRTSSVADRAPHKVESRPRRLHSAWVLVATLLAIALAFF